MSASRSVATDGADEVATMTGDVKYGVVLNIAGKKETHPLRWNSWSEAASAGQLEVTEKRAKGFWVFMDDATK